MPAGPNPSFADLAALLGESHFAWDQTRHRLELHRADLLGFDGDPDTAGTSLLTALGAVDRQTLVDLLTRPGGFQALEVRCRRIDGVPRWLRIRVAAGGDPLRIGTVADVTLERQVERGLRTLHAGTSSETGPAYLRALARATAEALGAHKGFVALRRPDRPDRMRTAAIWNRDHFDEDFEYPLAGSASEEVLRVGMVQSTHGVAARFPDDPNLEIQGMTSYLGIAIPGGGGQPIGVLGALDQRPLPALSELAPLLGAFAARAGAEIERERTEAELRRSESLFRQIVTSCAEGFAVLDAEGRFTYANAQLARMLGLSGPEALVGTNWTEVTVPEDLEKVRVQIQARRRGEAGRYEFRLRHADGSPILVANSAAPILDKEGRYAGTIALIADISEQRALDEQVREAQKLESLGLLAGGIAHDFNNLLVGILANAAYLISDLPPGSELRAAAEDARAAAQKASSLTRQLLAYSGRGTFQIGPVALEMVIVSMAALAGPGLGRQVKLVQAVDEGLPPVEGDAGQLGQLVLNLVTNAGEALGPGGGKVVVRARAVDLDAAALARFRVGEGLAPGRYVALEVSDDGAGMDEATQARVFEPFFSTKFAGRGLGLAAVSGILRTHHGAIRLESAPGRGSTFVVVLPVARGAVATVAPAKATVTQTAGRSVVLVADDEEVVRRAARRALERSGFEVLEASDGQQAVDAFRAQAPRIDCVLLDVTMPVLGGEEALERIRELRAMVPAVLTSGYSERDRAPTDGGVPVHFLAKPFGPADLVAAVRKAMGLPPPLPPR